MNEKDSLVIEQEGYIGNQSQLSGIEEHRLVGGKGDGMRLLEVRNGKGIHMTVSLDRCADLSRLYLDGVNLCYFSPNGYVAPSYYDDKGTGFLKSFTGGFLTTCGLNAVGVPCEDGGEVLPLHGTISNTPATEAYWLQDEKGIQIHATMFSGAVFREKLKLDRTIYCSTSSNTIKIQDTIENIGDIPTPCMILYHMNMGYPLLSESSILTINSKQVTPRDECARKGILELNKIIPPQKGFIEQCYYHYFDRMAQVKLYNPNINKGVRICYNSEKLPYFVQWKMMGYRDYVLGLEPGNCHPDGRDKMRKEGTLKILEPLEKVNYEVVIELIREP